MGEGISYLKPLIHNNIDMLTIQKHQTLER